MRPSYYKTGTAMLTQIVITNIPKEHKELALQAAKDTNFKIRITDDAVDRNGVPIKEDVCLIGLTLPGTDYGPYWKRYGELVKEIE